MSEPLSSAELDELRRIPTPAIANGIELFEIDTVVQGPAPPLQLRERCRDFVCDVVTDRDHFINFVESRLDQRFVELGQPFTVHMQYDFGVGVMGPNYGNKLRHVVYVDHVRFLSTQILRTAWEEA